MPDTIILQVENLAEIEAKAKKRGFKSIQEYVDYLITRDKLRYMQEQEQKKLASQSLESRDSHSENGS